MANVHRLCGSRKIGWIGEIPISNAKICAVNDDGWCYSVRAVNPTRGEADFPSRREAPHNMKTPASFTPKAHRICLERQATALANHDSDGRSDPDCCPLCALRALPTADRKIWIENLSEDELEFLLTYHSACEAEQRRRERSRRSTAGALAGLSIGLRV